MTLFTYIKVCARAWRDLNRNRQGIAVYTITRRKDGAVELTMAIASDRDAWELAELINESWDFTVESTEPKPPASGLASE